MNSAYICFNELKTRLKEEGIKIETDEEYRDFYKHTENVLQTFFNKILEIRAQRSHTENKIKFNRENIFSSMFCFAKKLYIGNVVDSEGELFPFDEPHHKIQGVPIKRSDMPAFAKVASEKLAFDIASGMSKENAMKFITDTYKQFCKEKVDDIAAHKSISDYTKYIPNPIQYYIENGLHFDKGQTFNAKCSLVYNYVIAKNNWKYAPISSGSKISYVYVKPNNKYGIEAVAFLEHWPKEFDSIFEIDHETMFRKCFLSLFESMFKILKWIGPGEKISLTTNKLTSFFF